ncbi:MAG: DUF4388 domain-containing protein, partial [Deltaproteobacteria bacterium]
ALVAIDLPKLKTTAGGEGSALHLAVALRRTPGLARLPILALDHGHLRTPKGVQSVLGLDVNGYVPDPTDRRDLLARLQSMLANTRGIEELSGSAKTLEKPPVQAGEVGGLELLSLAHGLFQLRRSGVLVVRWEQLERRLFFLDGAPVAYQSSSPADQFGRFLFDARLIEEGKYQTALAAMSRDGLSEIQALVAVGGLPTGEQAYDAARRYLRVKASQLLAMRGGRFAFHPGDEFKDEIDAVEVPPLGAVRDAALDGLPLRWLDEALRQRSALHPHRSPRFAELLPSLGLSVSDLKVVMRLDGRLSCRQVVRSGLADPRHLAGLIWFLGTAGALEFAAATGEEASGGFAAGQAVAPRKKKALPPELESELRRLCLGMAPGSYFAALGVDIAATPQELETAYRERSQRLHPEAYAEYELGELEELLTQARDKVSAAIRVLSQDEKRASYLRYLLARHPGGRSWSPVDPAAEVELKRGEKLMRQGDFASARECFERAAEHSPREPEVQALLAWATFQSGEGDLEARARRAKQIVKKALHLNPALGRPLVIAGILEEALGNLVQARKHYLQALQLGGDGELARRALERLDGKAMAG